MPRFAFHSLLFLILSAPAAFAGNACEDCECCRDGCCARPVPAEAEVVVAVHDLEAAALRREHLANPYVVDPAIDAAGCNLVRG